MNKRFYVSDGVEKLSSEEANAVNKEFEERMKATGNEVILRLLEVKGLLQTKQNHSKINEGE